MKKALKIIGFIALGLILVVGLLFYFGNKKLQRNELAELNANYIIENLDKEEVLKEFPETILKIESNLKVLLMELNKIVNGIKEMGNLLTSSQ